MVYLGAVRSAAQNLFDALHCSALKELCSVWGYESELEDLECSVSTIKSVLLDAESKPSQVELSHQAQQWLDELKHAVYDADDLLDEFVTLAEQQQLRAKDEEADSLFNKVRRFFSFDNPLLVALNMSRRIKDIRNKLDAIAHNHNQFGFKLDCHPIRRRREESCSYVYAKNIIGRENDVEKIITMLQDPNNEQAVSFLSIVGIGGLGKTTLAQLVYNDPRIKQEFSLRLWTCISDHDGKCLDTKAILVKIVQSAIGEKHEDLDMDHLQRKLRKKLRGNKYLLVLDDVWNEDRHHWLKLVEFLIGGLKGSWIMVTTRSRVTADVVGGGHTYDLKGLSEKDAWCLFESTAFGHGYEQANPPHLIQIGYDIVKRCANVPLAIKVVGSLIYGHDKEKWLLFREIGLGRIRLGEHGGIEPILKLSYDNLESPLKICFSYCALFPKGYEIEKEMLINLWIAQGYIVPLEEGQSVDDASEEYFSILLRRCFLQDVKTDKHGEIVSCKIHDLMHDIAQQIAVKEICVTNSITSKLPKKVRHLSHRLTKVATECSFARTKIRTYLQVGWPKQLPVGTLVANWMCLRVLDLSYSSIESLPSTLGKLLHLRYLDLSENHRLEMLPKSITELHNLQRMKLQGCQSLKELPKDLRKLVKLRVLDTNGCLKLIVMPSGMGKLSCLQKLPIFVVGADTNLEDGVAGQLEDLKALRNLKGQLFIHIKIKNLGANVLAEENVREGGFVKSKQHLNSIGIQFVYEAVDNRMVDYEEELMEGLQPHPNLKELRLYGYSGKRMPSWAREDNLATLLSNLVYIHVGSCSALQYLASLRTLPYLKSLEVANSKELEYIEDTSRKGNIDDGGVVFESEPFFPSLEVLTLEGLRKLKGWWRENRIMDSNEHQPILPPFPRLSSLRIWVCPHLTFIPPCPTVNRLQLVKSCAENMQIMTTSEYGHSKLRDIHTSNVGSLKLILSTQAFECVEEMEINFDDKVESFSEVREVFQICSSCLRSLSLYFCCKLKSVCGGLKHLAALEKLTLARLPNLNLSNAKGHREGEEVDGIPWQCLQHSLRSLHLEYLPQLVNLPKEMSYLTTLQTLVIYECARLESLPESIQELTSLNQLTVRWCSAELTQRCQYPTGEDWPNIQHIPHVEID